MNRPWLIWTSLAVCAILIFSVLGWLTQRSLAGERERLQSKATADYHERIRLALSRMDTLGTNLLVIENQRPPLHYQSFYTPGDLFRPDFTNVEASNLLQPSPLLTEDHDIVQLHFEIESDGLIRSPQVPEAHLRDLAYGAQVSKEKLEKAEKKLAALNQQFSFEDHFALTCIPQKENAALSWAAPNMVVVGNDVTGSVAEQKIYQENLTEREFVGRSNALNRSLGKAKKRSLNLYNQTRGVLDSVEAVPAASQTWSKRKEKSSLEQRLIRLSLFQPKWLEKQLFLIREVVGNMTTKYQGLWLDQEMLLREFKQELPKDLLGVKIKALGEGESSQFALASLPYQLVPGEGPQLISLAGNSLRKSLIFGWVAALIALGALIILLRSVLQLSERRAAFVSAVTHELRTPLTTFRLYSEMLADGMVKDEAAQQDYLRTMLGESERLNHLVENVLAYSQIERGTARSKFENLSVNTLLERLRPVLQRRVDQDGISLSTQYSPDLGNIETDVTAVEQILFNLIDNACKYGQPDQGEGEIILKVRSDSKFIYFDVQDHGKGILSGDQRKLFRAFHKSAQEAAHSKPGVGLGLALCRRLSRALKGELTLTSSDKGACFTLRLPSRP